MKTKSNFNSLLDLENIYNLIKNNQLEVKKADNGIPESIFRTYSAFANTNGGVILLGVEEKKDKSLNIIGILHPEKLIKEFWTKINDTKKISFNTLFDKHVYIAEIDNKQIIVIEIPRADRTVKPIFLNEKPFAESYRRNGEIDFLCSKEMIEAMFRDRCHKTQDMLVWDKLTFDIFDFDSVRRFRNMVSKEHIWRKLDDLDFLYKIGAIGAGKDGKLHPTTAGLLMFSIEPEIVRAFPLYFLDYQEQYDVINRISYRIMSSSGDWTGNLFDFYFKTYYRLIQNPKLAQSGEDVHKAISEALVNSLINSDYSGERGLVIRNYPDRIIMKNPGRFRINIEEAMGEGITSVRNGVIRKMFDLINIGEKTGMGMNYLFNIWKSQEWELPSFEESIDPDRTSLTLFIGKVAIKNSDETENKVAIISSDNDIINNKQNPVIISDNSNRTNIELAIKSSDNSLFELPKKTNQVAIKSSDKTNSKVAIKHDNRHDLIINIIKQKGEVRCNDLADIFKLSEQMMRRILSNMVKDGTLIALGENKNRRYALK